MRALVFDGQRVSLDERYPEPKPTGDELLIRPTLAGVSRGDGQAIGKGEPFVGVLGQEFVGIVEAAGPRVSERGKRLVGKRVVGEPGIRCGRCDMCTSGLSEHCRERKVLGGLGHPGCFADLFTLPAANVHAIPDHVDDDRAVFASSLAVACAIRQRLHMHIENQTYVTILGDSVLGLLAAQVLREANASVRVLGKHPAKLALCERWGVKHRPVDEVTPRADQDVVIVCTESAMSLATAMQMVRPRGKVVLMTSGGGETTCDLSPLVGKEIEVIGSRSCTMPEAVRLLAEEAVDVVSLISRRVKFNGKAGEALTLAQQPDVLRVILEMG